MPKIKNVDYWVGEEKRTATINYSPKSEEFYLSLPTEMFSIADAFIEKKESEMSTEERRNYNFRGVSKVSGRLESDSQKGLEELLKEYVGFYEEMNTKRRKVIVADFEYNSKDIAWSRGGEKHDGGYSNLRFNYWILWEYAIGNKKTFSPINSDEPVTVFNRQMPSSINNNLEYYKIIPYSEANEAFMKNFYQAMNALMKNIGNFCGSEEKLLNTISNGMKLLN